MKLFNHYTSNMPTSGIQKIFELSQGIEGCIHLEVGQPDFRTPEHILDAIVQAGKDGFTKYTAAAGIPELRQAIAKKVTEKNGFSAEAKNVVVSPGAVCSIMSSLIALAEPGDEILIPDPAWPNYIMQAACVACKAVRYPLVPSHGFQIDFDSLERLVTPKTKIMIINAPGNPTGVVFSRETIERIVKFVKKHDLFLISDEVYEEIIFEGNHISTGLYNDDGRIVSIFGFSKTYAVPGLRLGYTVCEEKLADLIAKLQTPLVSCPTSVSQKACLAALEGPQQPVYDMLKVYRERRDVAIEILKNSGHYLYTPSGAFYILIDISGTGMNSDDFALTLLKEKKVAVAPGETFGNTTSSFVRVSFTTDIDKLIEGMEILCESITAGL
ncbi:MAG: aminotransferase class I/II-fold pyridoxal phosphate-dependent enzyme [Candidatus Latescibacteria bacterium]|jgi:aspartate/methionine/tyrosine aminotransferase|nr:aminotransferase class I/II-fold pyridoxal phosphate-dependent enzyme [Candidatus Latescibacterota bacterium]